jgi:NAD(P)-dependent dehydrogenase (short-subunit alcohol dehydrogenase family)
MQINEKTIAVVTGAASGIGRALAVQLAQRGATVAIADVNESGLKETAALVGARCSIHLVDVSDETRMKEFVAEVWQAHGAVHLVINNAGVALYGTVAQLTTEEMAWLLGINLWGVIYGTKYFLPLLQQQREAHLVNISSVFGLIGFPGQSAYNASKFAVRGFTEALRHELEAENSSVRVSCVHPGGISTNIARAAREAAATTVDRTAEIERFERLSPTSPEKAAARIIRGVLRNEPRILIGPDAWLIDRLQRWLPVRYWRLFKPLVEWQSGKL